MDLSESIEKIEFIEMEDFIETIKAIDDKTIKTKLKENFVRIINLLNVSFNTLQPHVREYDKRKPLSEDLREVRIPIRER
jgi:hypothetical protein